MKANYANWVQDNMEGNRGEKVQPWHLGTLKKPFHSLLRCGLWGVKIYPPHRDEEFRASESLVRGKEGLPPVSYHSCFLFFFGMTDPSFSSQGSY